MIPFPLSISYTRKRIPKRTRNNRIRKKKLIELSFILFDGRDDDDGIQAHDVTTTIIYNLT